MKTLLDFTEDYIKEMNIQVVMRINNRVFAYDTMYSEIAKHISESVQFDEWICETFEDPSDETLSALVRFTLTELIERYINQFFTGLIQDRIDDYYDEIEKQKDPKKYYQAPLMHKL